MQRSIVLLIKPFVWWHSRCRCRHGLLNVPRRSPVSSSHARSLVLRSSPRIVSKLFEIEIGSELHIKNVNVYC